MNLWKAVRRWLRLPEKPLPKSPRRPTFMWEILNMILPEEHPRKRWRDDPYNQIANKRVDEVFPPD